MKKLLLCALIGATVVGCGGGSGGGNNGGSNPSPSPTPTPTPTASCTLPNDVVGTTFYGVTGMGGTGTLTFTGGQSGLTVTGLGSTGVALTPNADFCAYTGSNGVTGIFNENGIVSIGAVVNGQTVPAIALSYVYSTADQATATAIQGTYSLAKFQHRPTQNASYYSQLIVEGTSSNGTINATMKNFNTANPVDALIPATLVSGGANGGLTLMAEGKSVGTVYFKTVGTETIVVFGADTTADGTTQTGIMVGSNKPASSFNSGVYADSGISGGSNSSGTTEYRAPSNDAFTTVTASTIKGKDFTYTATFNSPVASFFSLPIDDQNVPEVGVASSLGFITMASQYGPDSTQRPPSSAVSPDFVFLLKPKQAQ